MCGITGILLAPNTADAGSLRAIGQMTSALRHRGPDGQAVWTNREAGIAFGHRRLAIVDLTDAGRQPMQSASGRYVITFNGEIYNFQDLRRELEGAGHCFRGTGDTEVMLCAIESWGLEAALTRFAGMFAFGLWDLKERILHLARDRMGKKPLYIASTQEALLFASELKAINCFPGFNPELNVDAAAIMLSKGWVPDDHCIWQGVFKLPPGSVLSVAAADFANARGACALAHRTRYWWSLADVACKARREPIAGSDEELTSELDSLLRLSVRERMVADVPLGAFLSGGIDSSTVVALMQAQSSRPVRTFTIAFSEAGFDEAPHAAAVARLLGTDHTELNLSPAEARDVIPELPRVWDEPFADESQIPTLLVARLARRHVTVALSGDGGDECFAGYSRHFMAARLRKVQGLPAPFRRMVTAGIGLLARASLHDFAGRLPLSENARHALRSDRLNRLSHLLEATGEDDLLRRLTGTSSQNLLHHQPPASRSGLPQLDDMLSRLLFDDMTGYLPGDILVKLDRATMASSLEGRCPILDHRVVEFSWRLPNHLKVQNGKGKWILRQLLGRYLPQRLIDRPKQGFDVPIGAWLRGPLRAWAADLIAGIRLSGDGMLDSAKVDACWHAHTNGERDHARDLWPVLMFQAWHNEATRPSNPATCLSHEIEIPGA
ncbi:MULTISPECIES: asparagine synthase (glutamine-hydrolyzing) [unclassified Mesorhizobium]|uniref:asparagine synthase (glutamine-hydrolyzing) n=1 Tax=unclassified Mesorhizobium TaxID=325217 RepID=UPI000FCBBA52|nr:MULTISPECIES: asparagine synthase (glutamine-hydrolyzing) [unclassified Mesorhizobium]RUX98079.1 asparagine synthase (glutamine-hydrolyzing) [Mesorhizobium sp. M7D.F.Ca.US.004.01.2.1]RVA36702.1 asparagine synthase (glutamine-hydrolyzing) [Mesorhizobium sp. M7D.F.Ca.US.004.03.1.1]